MEEQPDSPVSCAPSRPSSVDLLVVRTDDQEQMERSVWELRHREAVREEELAHSRVRLHLAQVTYPRMLAVNPTSPLTCSRPGPCRRRHCCKSPASVSASAAWRSLPAPSAPFWGLRRCLGRLVAAAATPPKHSRGAGTCTAAGWCGSCNSRAHLCTPGATQEALAPVVAALPRVHVQVGPPLSCVFSMAVGVPADCHLLVRPARCS